MDNAFKSFQRKIRNRQFAIENARRTQLGKTEVVEESAQEAAARRRWTILNENLSEADACKFFDGYLPLYSHRKVIGPAVVFVKKAIRKMIKICLGWYVFPIYQRQSHFNGKIVNSISVERDILRTVEERLAALENANGILTQQVAQAQEINRKLEEEAAALQRANEWLYSLVVEAQNANQSTALTVANLQEKQAQGMQLYEAAQTAAEEKWRESAAALDAVKQESAAGLNVVRKETAAELATAKRESAAAVETVRQETAAELATVKRESAAAVEIVRQETAEDLAVVKRDNETAVTEVKELLKKMDDSNAFDEVFYHHFEEEFRGARETIRERLQVYVPVVQEYLPDWSHGTFVDVGSGRGEWLDILCQHGATDYVGVDLNSRQNEIAERFGHKTVCCDCLDYLAQLPDGSVDLISGFQIIEHLCMSDLMQLLKQSYRVLKKGGMILFETQNPRNLVVGADTFYSDPTHKRPLEPRTTEFLAKWCGFRNVRCIDSNSHPEWRGLPMPAEDHEDYQLVRQFNYMKWLLFGPMDYALFAVKE